MWWWLCLRNALSCKPDIFSIDFLLQSDILIHTTSLKCRGKTTQQISEISKSVSGIKSDILKCLYFVGLWRDREEREKEEEGAAAFVWQRDHWMSLVHASPCVQLPHHYELWAGLRRRGPGCDTYTPTAHARQGTVWVDGNNCEYIRVIVWE